MAERADVDEQWRIPDELWERIEPLLPPERPHPKGGRPWMRARKVMDAIFYVLRTGCQWKALPRSLGAGSTVHGRFQAWEEAGVFRRLWQVGLIEFDAKVGIDWEWQAMDGAMTKAPLGGGKNRRQSDGSGQARHQAVASDRGAWCSHWLGRRRRQPPRHEVDGGDASVRGDRAA
jgi:transposase